MATTTTTLITTATALDAVLGEISADGRYALYYSPLENKKTLKDLQTGTLHQAANAGLSYDSNGNAAGGLTLLAALTTKPTLTAANFVVI